MVEMLLGEYGAVPRGVIERHEALVDGLLEDFQPIKPHQAFPIGNRYAAQRYQTGNWYATVAMIEGSERANDSLSTFTSVTLKEVVPTEVIDEQTVYKVIQLNTFKVPLGQRAFIHKRYESFGELHTDQVPLSRLFLPHPTDIPETEQDFDREAFVYSDLNYGDDPFHRIFVPRRRNLLAIKGNPNQEGQSVFASAHDIKHVDRVLGEITHDDVTDTSGRTLRERVAVREDTAIISDELQRVTALAQQRGKTPSWLTGYGQRFRIGTDQSEESGLLSRIGGAILRRPPTPTFQISDLGGVYKPLITREYTLQDYPDYGPSLVVAFPAALSHKKDIGKRWEVNAGRRGDIISMLRAYE